MAPRTRCSTSARVPCCLNMPRLVISVEHCAGEDGTGARFASRTRQGRHQDFKMMQLRAKLAESDFGVFSLFEALRRSESESWAELVVDGAARLGSRAPARRARNSRGHIVLKFGLRAAATRGLGPPGGGGPCGPRAAAGPRLATPQLAIPVHSHLEPVAGHFTEEAGIQLS